MKIRYLLFAATILFSISATAQINSDDPSLYNTGTTSNSSVSESEAKVLTTTVIPPCDSGSAMIIVSGECIYGWSSDSLGLNPLVGNDTLITGNLTSDTTFYLSTIVPTLGTDTTMTLPAHGSVFTGNIRGYYFQAPIDFEITKLRVPTEASTGNQNVAVLKFNSGPPPLFSATTNDFVEEGYWPSFAGDTIYTCIHVSAGDYIGIYGSRDDQNSYASAPFATDIAGIPVTLTRTGMQLPLSANAMSNVFSEAAGSLSRTEMFYTTSVDTLSPTAINVTIGQSYMTSSSIDICAGDSVLIGASYYFSDTTIVDSLLTMVSGCDSVSIVTLIVNALPAVTLAAFSQDSICIQVGTVVLPIGSPVGGTYTGTGVSGTDFDASISGVGTFTITYTYADSAGCSSIATTDITVNACVGLGIDEQVANLTSIYPNPVVDQLTINANDNQIETIKIVDALGRTISSFTNVSGTIQVSATNYASGVYFVIAQNGANYQSQRFVKK
jgi:hypothetical protein